MSDSRSNDSSLDENRENQVDSNDSCDIFNLLSVMKPY